MTVILTSHKLRILPVDGEIEQLRHEHFKIFRDYIEHEDELINQRLAIPALMLFTWLIVFAWGIKFFGWHSLLPMNCRL